MSQFYCTQWSRVYIILVGSQPPYRFEASNILIKLSENTLEQVQFYMKTIKKTGCVCQGSARSSRVLQRRCRCALLQMQGGKVRIASPGLLAWQEAQFHCSRDRSYSNAAFLFPPPLQAGPRTAARIINMHLRRIVVTNLRAWGERAMETKKR